MPPELRGGRKLRCVIDACLGRVVADAQEAESWSGALVEEMQYIGQQAPLQQLLDERFGEGCVIGDYEPADVVYFSPIAGAGEEADGRYPGTTRAEAVWVTPMSMVDVGCDFSVTVPSTVNVGEVDAFIRRYIFSGINFKIYKEI